MERIYIGTGGWSDNDPPYNRLKRYASIFDFVEVNSTFYEAPPLTRARIWRRTVPQDFAFTVKCSRVVTHQEKLQPTQKSLESLSRMLRICRELESRVLILQTPRSLKFESGVVEDFRSLLTSVRLEEMTLGLDPGGRYLVEVPSNL